MKIICYPVIIMDSGETLGHAETVGGAVRLACVDPAFVTLCQDRRGTYWAVSADDIS